MSDQPKHDVIVTTELLHEIAEITTPHLKALNEDITERFPVAPDMYVALAIGFIVSVLLGNLSNPEERMSAAAGITSVVRYTGFALTPVT
jgi:hypothetical protein